MKTHQLKDIKLSIAEGIQDITPSREKDLQQLYLLLTESVKTPIELITECIDDFNSGMYVNMAQKMKNYLDYTKITKNINIWNSIFCLISYEKDEKKETLSESEIQEKAKRLEENGLNFDLVKREVENFMKVYPSIMRVYKIVTG